MTDPKKRALLAPRMTVLSDRPLSADTPHLDRLNLEAKLGPVYDILRHSRTQTPLAVAIYGDWGTGKTSAMRWLEGLLTLWNDNYTAFVAEHQRHKKARAQQNPEAIWDQDLGVIVRPVWFCPWKYQDKNDVWRGLIAEVILASIDIRGATEERVKEALKQFGLFLGRSFLHAITAMRVSQDGVSANMGWLKNVMDDYHETAHPEDGYLNKFEKTLGKWIRETISDADERLVIFIDDLDRCLPEVALRVLEALKLYLDIPDLVFVVGVDRDVIDQLVREHYTRLGLEAEKSKHYLAKMFQVEVVMAPNEGQAETFLDQQLSDINEYTNQYWSTRLFERQRAMFRRVLLDLAQRNPRELKRLLNSALIHGAGALHVSKHNFSFAQGIQVYLVRKILDEQYTMSLHVDTKTGMRFFHEWSKIVRAGGPCTVPPALLAKAIKRRQALSTVLDIETPDIENPTSSTNDMTSSEGESGQTDAASAYGTLLDDEHFSTTLLDLLTDDILGELMQVEYPANTSALAETSEQTLPQGLIRETIARLRNKAPAALNEQDFRMIRQLDLEGMEISDLRPLTALTELQELVLSFTEIESIAPLSQLTKLTWLALARTRVSDLAPIQQLRQLRQLSLADTQVVDLTPLQSLSALESLNLRAIPAKDIKPITHLPQLTSLSLSGMSLTDLTPVSKLTQLSSLSLVNMKVRDLRPLMGLTKLTSLHLSHTQVSDLSPLSGLTQLKTISLTDTPLSDISPLHRLPGLRTADVRNTAVAPGQIDALTKKGVQVMG